MVVALSWDVKWKVDRIMIFEYKNGLCSQGLMIEAIWYKFKDVVYKELDLFHSYRMVKWKGNKLELYTIPWDYVRELFTIEIGLKVDQSFD